MAPTAERAKRLIQEDGEYADVLSTLLAVSADGATEIEWRDVNEDLTSGQWGRLIQEGVLEAGEDGFVLSDPEAIETVLKENHAPLSFDFDDIDADVNWTTYDKLAGALTVLFMVGYWFDTIRNYIGEAIHLLLLPLEQSLPFMALVLAIAMVTGLYSALLQANLMDTEVIGAYQEQMQAIQDKRKAAEERGDEEELEQIREQQMESMGNMLDMFKAQFRPMVWITLLTIPIFLWLYWFVGTGELAEAEMEVILPLVGEARWDGTFLGPMPTWILWYVVCSIGFGQLMRKALNIKTSPD